MPTSASAAVQRLTSVNPVSAQDVRRRSTLDRISWDNLRLLLVLAEAGSFRSAALVAGVSLNTIRTKIDRLEHQIGAPLLVRSVEGVRLTQDGGELVSIAREMRALGKTAHRVQANAIAPIKRDRQIRITVTEGLGTFWLVPRLVEFIDRNPDIQIKLDCDMAVPDVLFRDVDIAILLVKPINPDLIVQRVGTLHLMPFAADSYLRAHGTPASLADAADHKLVWQESEQLAAADDILPLFVDPAIVQSAVCVTTNTSSAHYWAVVKGTGIGFLPTYARAVTRSILPLDVGLRFRRDIFLVHHPESIRFPAVRCALDWVRDAFDRTKFPWFADEFVHPNDFERRFTDGVVVNLFEGFMST